MLGSRSEAEDAVQEAWLRLSGARPDEVENLGGWLTTVVARISLNVLRARKVREHRTPEPSDVDPATPEQAAALADGVSRALLVVLEKLAPAERVAFVLHDVLDMSFEDIATILERTPEATRQLASRGRRRVHEGDVTHVDADMQRRVVSAFIAAAQNRDYDALIAVLHPGVVLHAQRPGDTRTVEVRGADNVARRSKAHSRPGLVRELVMVDGVASVRVTDGDGQPVATMSFVVCDEQIVDIEIVAF